MVNYITAKDETQNLIKTFKMIDKNGDGLLSKKELLEGSQSNSSLLLKH